MLFRILLWDLEDAVIHSKGFLAKSIGWLCYCVSVLAWSVGFDLLSVKIMMLLHRKGIDESLSRKIVMRLCVKHFANAVVGNSSRLRIIAALNSLSESRLPKSFDARDFDNLLGSRFLVLKSWTPGEKGVLFVDYSYTFPILRQKLDFALISERYNIVLEPSWSGFATPEILGFAGEETTLFIEASEHRDSITVSEITDVFVPLATASNWWVDHREFVSDGSVSKVYDIVVIAAWAKFKRHWKVLRAIKRIVRSRRNFKALFIGYDNGLGRASIERTIDYFGLSEHVVIKEGLTPSEVSNCLRLSRVHVLWSRREGVNKAMIEAMLCDVPTILPCGFNYGEKYRHINSQTGIYAEESGLAAAILFALENLDGFSPRNWIMGNMTPQIATGLVNDKIKCWELENKRPWTRDLVCHSKTLHTQEYWFETDRCLFDDDYKFLKSCLQ
jgi:glycosyltransferase involved in cell wall biosynthesis